MFLKFLKGHRERQNKEVIARSEAMRQSHEIASLPLAMTRNNSNIYLDEKFTVNKCCLVGQVLLSMPHKKPIFRRYVLRDSTSKNRISCGAKPGRSGYINGKGPVDPAFQTAGIGAGKVVTAW